MPNLEKNMEEESEAISVEIEKIDMKAVVRKATVLQKLLSIILAIALSLIGGIAIFVELTLLHFPFTYSFVVILLLLIFPIFIVILAFYRNRIFEKLINRFSSYSFLLFARFWKIYYYLIFITTILLFVLGLAVPNDLPFKILPLLVFGVSLPFYYLFSFSLTSEEEITILFENLLPNLDHFSKRNVFWGKIAKKIEELLKTGNIEVSKDDLIYYFNEKLWETNTIVTNQLRDIEIWLLDRQSSCFNSIRQIIPEVCFQPLKRKSFSRNIVSEPTSEQIDLIKALTPIIVVVVVAILIFIHPEFVSQIHLF